VPKRRPNLLFIITDQQRPDTMACYGNDIIQTPNVNALARDSFVFQHGYVSQPVCVPSRSTIMTGLYPHTNGCTSNNTVLSPRVKTMGELTSDSYRKGYHGKRQLGDERTPKRGFTDYRAIEDGYHKHKTFEHDPNEISHYAQFLMDNGRIEGRLESDDEGMGPGREIASSVPEEFTKAAFLGNEAVRFIRESGNQPFILYTSFLEPRPPYNGPLNDMYPRNNLQTGPTFLKPPPANASMRNRMLAWYYQENGYRGKPLRSEADWLDLRARYWGLVTLVDLQIGRIVRALEESGQADNTIIVHTSDHGDMLGDHSILVKTVLYEASVKVPYIIRVPWLGNGRMVPGRVSNVDFVPTLLDLMAEEIPDNIQGNSLVPVMQGRKTLAENDVVVQWNRGSEKLKGLPADKVSLERAKALSALPWRSYVTADNWKLNLADGDQCELYDLNTDPHEMDNKFNDPKYDGRVKDMAQRLHRWQERTGDDAKVHPEGL